ncbi:Crp/Fnr family transcriptional regulator [Pelagibacterium montanilacus]|uniref:Crp/Fnr family transcriptional regulator n=1 Tax=Pelagibacterium montanilacus TaxID=2185280 RepID=UPI0013DEECAD|nr:Crp/Fnr family transcriptional regulator [Pelagibacterium montanilacus]
MVNENPGLQRALMMQSFRDLERAQDWMVTLARADASQKLARCLNLIALNHQTRDAGRSDQFQSNSLTFELPLSRSDIADLLGLRSETVSHQLTHLRRAGVIAIGKLRQVSILDLKALRRRY